MTSRSVSLLSVVLGGLSLLSVGGCDSTEPSTPTSVVLSPTAVTLDAVGATHQLSAEVRDQRDQPLPDEPITWTSNDATVAGVSSTGLVTAVADGITEVTATAGSLSGSATVGVAQVVTQIVKVSGDAQSDTVAQTLANPLAVQVRDRLSQPVSGQTVSFAIAAGNGSVDPATALSDEFGRASTVFTLGTTSGTNHRVNASHPAVALPVAFTATALAGPPDSVERVQGNAQTGGAGLALADSIVVRVLDEFGNPVPNQPVLFQVAVGSGSASPDSVNTETLGRAATRWTLGADAGEDTLHVRVGALPTVTFTATAVAAGPPANLAIFDGDGQTGLVGFAVNIPPSVLVTDTLGIPISNVDVTFTVTSGGGTVSGAMAQTDPKGIATVGAWALGASPGTNALDATAAALDTVTFTASGVVAAYDIEVRFLTTVTVSQEQAFLDAAARWEVLIFGDLSDINLSADSADCGENSPPINEVVDDLLILATVDSIDGPGNILGQAGPCFIRLSNSLPILGAMIFDEADLAMIEANGNLDELILHEMGHVIGLGTIWSTLRLLSGAGGSDPHFTGTRAIEAFDRIGGAGYTGGAKVPVENMGGAGTRDAHWRESVFGTELMTGFLNGGVANPISEVTTASFWDMAYLVNLDGSDGFALLSALRIAGGPEMKLVDDIARLPIYVVESGGRIVDVLPGR